MNRSIITIKLSRKLLSHYYARMMVEIYSRDSDNSYYRDKNYHRVDPCARETLDTFESFSRNALSSRGSVPVPSRSFAPELIIPSSVVLCEPDGDFSVNFPKVGLNVHREYNRGKIGVLKK